MLAAAGRLRAECAGFLDTLGSFSFYSYDQISGSIDGTDSPKSKSPKYALEISPCACAWKLKPNEKKYILIKNARTKDR